MTVQPREPIVTPTDRIDAAVDGWTEEWDHWLDRRFPATQRTIRVEQSEGGWYSATINGALRFPPTPNLDTVIRFVRAFAVKEGVRVDEDSVEYFRVQRAFGEFSPRSGSDPESGWRGALPTREPHSHSVKVPDNVIALPVRAEA